MSRFPKSGRKPKNKQLSIFQQARRFYGEAFDVSSSRDLADAMADWSDLGAPERTFPLSHLLYLNLMALAGVQTLLHELLVTVEDVADDLIDEDGEDGDDEDEDQDDDQDSEPEDLEDDDESDSEPPQDEGELLDAPPPSTDELPPGVTIPGPGPVVITPAVDEHEQDGDDNEGDHRDDVPEQDELDEDDEG